MRPSLRSLPILGLTLLYFSLTTALSLTTGQQLSAPLVAQLSIQSATDMVAIQQVINAFAVAIDQRRFDLLDHVFTPDVTVNFNIARIPVLHNLNDVSACMGRILQGYTTFHVQSTHYIRFSDPNHAVATTYNSATYMENPGRQRPIVKLGRYEDQLVKTATGWLISNRVVVHVGTGSSLQGLSLDNSNATFI